MENSEIEIRKVDIEVIWGKKLSDTRKRTMKINQEKKLLGYSIYI